MCFRWLGFLLLGMGAVTANAQFYNGTILNASHGSTNIVRVLGVSPGSQVGIDASGSTQPTLWTGTAASAVNLLPTGAIGGIASGVSGDTQVGVVQLTNSDNGHPFLWHGTASSAVNLTPDGFTGGRAFGVDGTHQVGIVDGHAQLWTGTAASAIDLNPAGFIGSTASAVSGNRQGGFGNATVSSSNHALLWNGSAASAIDLHPAGFDNSQVTAISGGLEGGEAGFNGPSSTEHAMLWSGSSASAVDLNPAGYLSSTIVGMGGGLELGSGIDSDGHSHALLWNGTAASVVDLASMVNPLSFNGSSIAFNFNPTSIDSDGNIGGYIQDSPGVVYGVLLTPSSVPEPASLASLALGLGWVLIRRRRRGPSALL
jgi:hypothetical protein